MSMRRASLAFLVLALSSAGAKAELLQCAPEEGRLRVQIVGVGRGETLPDGLETFTASVRAGADEYEISPEHMTASSLKQNILRVAARRPLSAGEVAELTLEGKVVSGGEFLAEVIFRAEGREMRGMVRCKLI